MGNSYTTKKTSVDFNLYHKLGSNRWQTVIRINGDMHTRTFSTRKDAETVLRLSRDLIISAAKGVDPSVNFTDFEWHL